MADHHRNFEIKVEAISRSGLTIYDFIPRHVGELWIPTFDLERMLNHSMMGIALAGLQLRTRSKVVKEHICRALGYPVPSTFRRTQPRFPGQHFDVYVQKSDNVQVWNEDPRGALGRAIVDKARHLFEHITSPQAGSISEEIDSMVWEAFGLRS